MKESVMESKRKEEYYQLEEYYLKENTKKQTHTKVHDPWNKVKPKIEKRIKISILTLKEEKRKNKKYCICG